MEEEMKVKKEETTALIKAVKKLSLEQATVFAAAIKGVACYNDLTARFNPTAMTV